ncbi:helix-turn-helix domain-containing protein [Aureimonas sp. AU40]|uniref:helix-turn-helix domain-containing protein n=1 Tax=Aureimonas sp. AU40 TaxID=1637747 RepID=UPI000781EF59|nr:helix-turn-helix transcriptional regulator [Aureimonas sp. AU40]
MSEARRELTMLMEETKTTQRRLADLLGVSYTTVNRWFCVATRSDALDPPFYAVNFMRAYIQLNPRARDGLPVG